MALAYANVVMTENYWCRQVRASRLGEKYATTLLTLLRGLPERLIHVPIATV